MYIDPPLPAMKQLWSILDSVNVYGSLAKAIRCVIIFMFYVLGRNTVVHSGCSVPFR